MRGRPAAPLAVLFAAALALGTPAGATHAPDHRFIVVGYVTDEGRRPLGGVPVLVTRIKTGLEYRTRTEGDGFYVIVVHLHDDDRGERLAIRAGAARGEIVARFDPYDRRTERGT